MVQGVLLPITALFLSKKRPPPPQVRWCLLLASRLDPGELRQETDHLSHRGDGPLVVLDVPNTTPDERFSEQIQEDDQADQDRSGDVRTGEQQEDADDRADREDLGTDEPGTHAPLLFLVEALVDAPQRDGTCSVQSDRDLVKTSPDRQLLRDLDHLVSGQRLGVGAVERVHHLGMKNQRDHDPENQQAVGVDRQLDRVRVPTVGRCLRSGHVAPLAVGVRTRVTDISSHVVVVAPVGAVCSAQ